MSVRGSVYEKKIGFGVAFFLHVDIYFFGVAFWFFYLLLCPYLTEASFGTFQFDLPTPNSFGNKF